MLTFARPAMPLEGSRAVPPCAHEDGLDGGDGAHHLAPAPVTVAGGRRKDEPPGLGNAPVVVRVGEPEGEPLQD
eukprot:3559987-Pyramimonas_sp.AAC.1